MFPDIQETVWVAVYTACEALIACVNQLNIMDGERGSGDYGTVIAQGAKAVQDAIQVQDNEIERNLPHVAFKKLSNVIRDTVDDHEAGIYSVFFYAIAESLKDRDQQITEATLLNAFIAGNRAISENKKVHERKRSMLDALLPAEQKLVDELRQGSSPIVAFGAAVKAAEESAMRTVRVADLNTTYRYPEPGAHAVGIWMRAAYEATKLRVTRKFET